MSNSEGKCVKLRDFDCRPWARFEKKAFRLFKEIYRTREDTWILNAVISVYAILALFASDDSSDEITRRIQTISEWSGIGKHNVDYALQDLQAMGFIRIIERSGSGGKALTPSIQLVNCPEEDSDTLYKKLRVVHEC